MTDRQKLILAFTGIDNTIAMVDGWRAQAELWERSMKKWGDELRRLKAEITTQQTKRVKV